MFDVWHIGIPVMNLEKSVDFYVNTLGFERIGNFGDNLSFIRPPGGQFTIELMELKDASAEELARRPHHLAFEAEDLDSLRKRLLKKLPGVAPVSPSVHGMRLFSVKDPDGITVQFYQGRGEFDRVLQTTGKEIV